ncbi:MAG: serine/threonine protein kinase [Kofleriaceae bacterium]|nr:serine/threonine protein kinase [Kofleriaceae bacterium]
MPSLGRYEILRLIAKGGMAEVFLARRRSAGGIDKRVVVKRIRSERATDPRLMALFVREARVSMALSHQNIVPVFDFGRAGDALLLAMEHVDGRDLGALLAAARDRAEPLDPVLVAFIGAECCAALAYAHGRDFEDGAIGVIHRDVTPRNILLSWSGEVRLTDFGVAALRREDVGAVRGTPGYMAPEQARGEQVDGRADLYALGLVLREAATGQRARAAEPAEAMAQARAGELVPLAPDGPAMPPGLAAIVARATAARVEDRFADARAMHHALEEFALDARAERRDVGVPSRLLADRMAALFGADRGSIDDRPQPMEAVTFLDDGEEALLGTATAHSLAETAAGGPPTGHELEVGAPAPPAPATALRLAAWRRRRAAAPRPRRRRPRRRHRRRPQHHRVGLGRTASRRRRRRGRRRAAGRRRDDRLAGHPRLRTWGRGRRRAWRHPRRRCRRCPGRRRRRRNRRRGRGRAGRRRRGRPAGRRHRPGPHDRRPDRRPDRGPRGRPPRPDRRRPPLVGPGRRRRRPRPPPGHDRRPALGRVLRRRRPHPPRDPRDPPAGPRQAPDPVRQRQRPRRPDRHPGGPPRPGRAPCRGPGSRPLRRHAGPFQIPIRTRVRPLTSP